MSSSELVPMPDPATADLVSDPAQYVVEACERAKAWLSNALEHGDIDQIVELKSQAEAIRVYTRQKELGKDAELSAAEIVRRAERGIGVAIRKGQAAGQIAVSGTRRDLVAMNNEVPIPTTTEAAQVKHRSDVAHMYALTDDVTEEQFEESLSEAKKEGNLSRANVVRKVRGQKAKDDPDWIPERGDNSPAAAARRREVIRELSVEGYTSAQIGNRLDMLPDTVRRIARDEDIAITADVVMGVSKRTRTGIDSNRVVRETVASLEGVEVAVNLIDFEELDGSQIHDWTTSLDASIRALNRLNRKLKEMVQ